MKEERKRMKKKIKKSHQKRSLRKEIIAELSRGIPVELFFRPSTVYLDLKTKKDMKVFEEVLNNHIVVNCFFKPLQKRIDDILMKQGNGKADWVDALNLVKKEMLK